MYNYNNHPYGMHPIGYISLKIYYFETVYTTMSSENDILTNNFNCNFNITCSNLLPLQYYNSSITKAYYQDNMDTI
jgi:hypothetical protein